jgi:hypothetical protein
MPQSARSPAPGVAAHNSTLQSAGRRDRTSVNASRIRRLLVADQAERDLGGLGGITVLAPGRYSRPRRRHAQVGRDEIRSMTGGLLAGGNAEPDPGGFSGVRLRSCHSSSPRRKLLHAAEAGMVIRPS